MLTKENREELNQLIRGIKFYDKELDALVKSQHLTDRETFEGLYDRAYHSQCYLIEDFNRLINKIWYNNFDLSVQKSLNYYLKKSGLPQRKLTAIM